MQDKCAKCIYSRPVVSENGIHYACCLSPKKAVKCLFKQIKGCDYEA